MRDDTAMGTERQQTWNSKRVLNSVTSVAVPLRAFPIDWHNAKSSKASHNKGNNVYRDAGDELIVQLNDTDKPTIQFECLGLMYSNVWICKLTDVRVH